MDTTIAADIVRRFYEPFRTGDTSVHDAGFAPGWGFFPLALEALLIVAFTVWIARRPFPTS